MNYKKYERILWSYYWVAVARKGLYIYATGKFWQSTYPCTTLVRDAYGLRIIV